MVPNADTTCPGCGSNVTTTASEGLCAACLLTGVLLRGDFTEAAPPMEDPATLRRCGEYELLGILARGGMGVVFRARQEGLTREVALKMIAAADLAAPDDVRRFRLEAELIARLDHPNIVPVHTVGEHDGRPFFVMKLAERGTLAQALAAQGPAQDVKAAVRLMVKVARAVQFAHDRGVLHRDLKPGNILLDAAGEPLVSDFGLARLAQSAAGSHPSAAGAGTPAYMAPEQAAGSSAVTTASDVYGLGAVLYHLLTGRPPFQGATALEVLRRAETEEPASPQSLNPRTGRDLATVCLKCLEKPPARRYASAAAFADDLERWLRGEPVTARAAGWAERTWKWAKRRPALATLTVTAIAGTAVLSAVLAAGNVLLRKERNYAREQEAAARQGTALAQASSARAEASEQAMRLHVYASDMILARRALDDGNIGKARLTLARQLPKEGQPDNRGFEWYALQNLCRGNDLHAFTAFSAAVISTAWSPDGLLLAAGGRDNQICFFQAADRSPALTLPREKPQSKIAELAMLAALPRRSPETTRLLAPGDGVSIDEVRMRSRPSSLGVVSTIAWSPDGASFVTAGEGSYLRVWNANDWSMQGFIPVKNCAQAAFSPDSRLIIAAVKGAGGGSMRGEIRVYAAETLECRFTVTDAFAHFAVARETALLATAHPGGAIRLHDLTTGQLKHSLQLAEEAFGIAITPDGERLALLHRNSGTIRSTATGQILSGLQPSGERFRCLAFSPDGSLLATGCAGHTVQIFDGRNGTPVATLRGHEDEVLSLSFSPDGKALLTGGNDHTARLWNPLDYSSPASDIDESGTVAAATPDGGLVLAQSKSGVIRCLDTDGQVRGSTPPGPVRRTLGFHPDGGRFVTFQPDRGIIEWWRTDGTPDGKPVTIPIEPGSIWEACPRAGWLAVAPKKKGPTLYDWRTGTPLRTLPRPPVNCFRMEISPSGRFLLAFDWPNVCTIFDFESDAWQEKRKLSSGTVGPVVFSADSTLMASGGDDNLVTVRETLTGNVLASLRGHMAEIKALAFSHDGRTLASSSTDATIRLWHTPTWRELGPLLRGPLCTALQFTPRGLLAEDFERRWLVLEGQPQNSAR